MTDVNPTEIYRRYERNELDEVAAVGYLKSIIEGSNNEDLRVRSVEILGKMDLKAGEVFQFFEHLISSDENSQVRLESLKIIVRNFLHKSILIIHHVIKHEKSADNLYGLYKELENVKSKGAISLKNDMELFLGDKYIKKFNLIPREAMALQIIELEVGTEATHVFYWHDASVFAVEPKNGKVVDLVIYDYNFSEIKYLDLFSQLDSLTISSAGVKEIANLQTLRNLKFLDLSLNEIREIKGLDSLTKLKTFYVNDNPIRKIEGIDHLKDLKDFNFEETLISEGDYYDFNYQFIPFLLNKADSNWITKKYEKAIETCKRILELDPKQPEAYYYLGLVYYETKNIHKAILYYNKALKLDRNLKKAWYNLGISYFHLNKNILAKGALLLSLGLNYRGITDEYTWIFLAKIYSRRNLYKRALKSGLKAIEANPKYWNAYTHTGYYYFILQNYDKAITIFKEAVKINSNDFFSWNYMGLSYAKLGKFEELRKISEKIIKQKPKDTTARINMGLLCMRDSQPIEAIRHFKRAANNKNLDSIDCYTLATNFQKLDEYNLAINLTNRGLNRNPRNKKLIELKKNLESYKGNSFFYNLSNPH